jgi:hypothetical protein
LHIHDLLIRYDTVLSIEELLEVDERLCTQNGVTNFSVFTYDDNDNDDNPANFISFLNKYHRMIDPHGNLSVYEHATAAGDRAELYSFVRHLSIISDEKTNEEQHHVAVISGDANAEQIQISAEKISAVEKAVKHKFGGLIGCRNGSQIIQKAKQRSRKNKYSSIQ